VIYSKSFKSEVQSLFLNYNTFISISKRYLKAFTYRMMVL
jgi:hypothetical protein